MPLTNFRQLVAADAAGQTSLTGWRKQPTQTTAQGIWFDLSMSPGNPVPNYYIGTPYVFTPLAQSTHGGIPHGGNVSPMKKYLRVLEAQTTLATAVPLALWLCDYLGFYPFLDESETAETPMINTTPVPRYPTGAGVQMMAVVVGGQTGGGFFRVVYTNSDGVAGRITPSHAMTTQAVNGTILTAAGAVAGSAGPFMALRQGDKGVRTVDAIQFEGSGDIGLVSIVLVKPIAPHYIRAVDAPSECDYLMHKARMPEICDDAYLNLVALPVGTLNAAPIYGYLSTLFA